MKGPNGEGPNGVGPNGVGPNGVGPKKSINKRSRSKRSKFNKSRLKKSRLNRTKANKKNRLNINKTKVNNSRNKKPLVVVSNTFKKANCAPSNNKKDYTCYSDSSLIKMKNLWNARHPDHKIQTDSPYEIWSQLRSNMSDVCDTETCWLKQQFIANDVDKELSSYTFTPKSPKSWTKNPTEWLSSVDIENVMKQYEKTYKCFDFLGPSPIDFDTSVMYGKCVWEELCNFDLKKHVSKGKHKIGIIFNTDPHYKSGSHWISLFINTKKGFIFFFDSNGDPAPKEIVVLCNRVIQQAKDMGLDLQFNQNAPLEHQYENTECGMYSLYFIISLMMDTHDPTYFMKHRITDNMMKQMRYKFFRVGE